MGKVRLSLRDMARMAGTSTATVSRVLSHEGGVRLHLRERVLNLVRETGYVPNAHASAMARQRFVRKGLVHRTIAIVLFNATDTAFIRLWEETYEGILTKAHTLELGVTLCLVRPEDSAEGLPPSSLTRIPCDGILSGRPPLNADPSILTRIAPMVILGGDPTQSHGLPSVTPDDYAGIAGLMEYLCSLGHRRFEFVPFDFEHQPYADRAEAFRDQVRKRGMAGGVADPTGDRFQEYAAAFTERSPETRPTALLVSSDGPAVSLVHALQVAGVRVPEQVSVVGFDGRPCSDDNVPPLTSWHVDWREIGRLGVETLVDIIAGNAAPTRVLVGGSVLERRSAGPPPG